MPAVGRIPGRRPPARVAVNTQIVTPGPPPPPPAPPAAAVRPFDFPVLVDEHSLGVPAPEGAVIRLFDLGGLGLDDAGWRATVDASFDDLAFDPYDVRRRQAALLAVALPPEPGREALLAAYYRGEVAQSAIEQLVWRLDDETHRRFTSILPHRKRSASRWLFDLTTPDIGVRRVPVGRFSQPTGDFRAVERTFEESADSWTAHPVWQALLRRTAGLVRSLRPRARTVEAVCHQMLAYTRRGGRATNAPEGVHQDGADFIVSALVIRRRNCVGGASIVLGPDQKTHLLRHVLSPGQGLFQSDAGSPLWHDVSPISCGADGDLGERGILGLDFTVIE